LLHNHPHLSSGAGTIGQNWPQYKGLSPTPLAIKKWAVVGRGDSLRWPLDTLYPLKLSLTSPTGGGRSVGIVRLRTKAIEFVFLFFVLCAVERLNLKWILEKRVMKIWTEHRSWGFDLKRTIVFTTVYLWIP
jgi:hypothetical protein